MATVSELIHYPVKGCAGMSVPRLDITPTGPTHDRTFMFVTPEGTFRSQRTTPRLAIVRPDLDDDGAKLTLSAPGRPDLAVAVRTEGERVPVTVHHWSGTAIDQGDDAAAWASAVLDEPVRLMRVPPDHERRVDDTHGAINFTDSTALHLTALSSLDDLNARILERGADPVPMVRFRPNIVVAGWATPFTEDDLRSVRVGGAELRYVKPDVRCKVTMVDQDAGTSAGPEPLRTLATFRREPDGGVSFGIKLAVRTPGPLAVGDELAVGWAN
ncbi:MAG TPA: MOSC N-terminal beta barrel domain-containing protein [Actinophytocola sp.]|nr:MOSC N-terminal beta barrel domain-containing protein [Actinophytocola sp.]